jgi:uncharacterized protein YgbK (DUF1537 family)
MSVRFAVIADDFTGGLFVASNLERLGIPVVYVCDPDILPAVGNQEVVVVATRLRFMQPDEAVARLDVLTTALDAIGTRHFFTNIAQRSIPRMKETSAPAPTSSC